MRHLAILLLLLSAALPAGSAALPSGKMELLTLRSKIFGNTRTIRIWLPSGYYLPSQRARKFPVFYFTDGIATFHGRQLDRIAQQLIQAGKVPPTIFVGIDNGGSTKESKNPVSDRAKEYLPYPDDTLQPPVPSPQGKLFPAFLEEEVRPLVESRYRTNGTIGLGGSSYGAAIVLFTAMEKPGRYQWLLLESPSLYINNDALIHRAEDFQQWPPRVYIGAGTNEGEGDVKREVVDDVSRLAKILQDRTATCLIIVPGAAHNEDAWRARLPRALKFLLGGGECPAQSRVTPKTKNGPTS